MGGNRTGDKDDGHPDVIDRIIHEPARLNIMAQLYMLESADFIFLMRQTGMTWGNLSSHMSRLDKAGYITIEKEFVGKRPHTMLRLTEGGREAFQRYRENMKQFFSDMPE